MKLIKCRITGMEGIFGGSRIFGSLCLNASVFLFFSKALLAQSPHFRNPLDIPIQLSANFGELRTDHYHTGYDMRTNAKTGYAVHACASGHVSRIKVSPVGFGNVLYISHPGGYMTVYGHLDRFNDEIAKYVKEQQYAKKSFEVELFPAASEFPVKEGDLIAYSGNSGGSEGPHLHFEIRDASGETYPLNPKDFLPVTDREGPQFSALYVYDISGNRQARKVQRYPVSKGENEFRVVSASAAAGKSSVPRRFDTIIVSTGAVGLAAEARDLLNGNTNGIYKLICMVDGEVTFSLSLDRLDFANGRYVNAHLDYAAWREDRTMIRKFFLLPGDKNGIYPSVINRGVIQLKDTLHHSVQLMASDDQGNSAVLNFVIKKKNVPENRDEPKPAGTSFAFDRANSYSGDSMKLNLPAGALYEDFKFTYSLESNGTGKYFSALHHVHKPEVPLHSFCDLQILSRKIPEALKPKAVIVYRSEKGRVSAKTTRWEGSFLATRIREFGDYYVVLDTTKPKISTTIKQNQLLSSGEVSFTVTDNLSGITKYNAYIDDQWTLTGHDPKNDRMWCDVSKSLATGEHKLKLVVSDEVNNEATFILTFRK